MNTTKPDWRSSGLSRLYRDPAHGVLLGVCAGIAEYLGLAPRSIRIATVLAGLFFTVPTVGAYLLAGLFLERRPDRLFEDPQEEAFARTLRRDPPEVVHAQRARLRALDRRLAAMERYVTSARFDLDRRFREL